MSSVFGNIPYLHIWVSLFLGFAILILFTYKKLKLNNSNKVKKIKNKNKKQQSTDQQLIKTIKKEVADNKTNKKQVRNNTRSFANEKFTHNWLKTSFKGHTGQVTSADLSSNGKYLASSSDDVLDAERMDQETGTQRLSRRQRKNRKLRAEKETPPSSTTSSPGVRKKPKPLAKKQTMDLPNEIIYTSTLPILNKYKQLTNHQVEIPEIVYYMQKYLIEKRKIEYHGFPQERSRGNTMIYKIGPNDLLRFLVNSKDFPGNIIINRADDLPQRDSDSGKGSSGSESRDSVSSEENDMKLIVIDNLKSIEPKQQHIRIINNKSCFERECCRCKQLFYVNFDREYMSKEYCRYHHGKLYHIYDGTNRKEYTCCKQGPNSLGCASAYRHVWNGVVDGLNGPYKGFVRTLPATSNQTQEAYALDCEMCYTADGLELTKVTVVSITGNLTYDTYVRPTNDIVDYNTRFSGITENLLIGRDVKSLNEVQSDLLKIFNEDTILIGHGLQSDMAALKLIHNTVIDTSVIYPHYKGLPIRQSLKHLTKVYLGKDIQNGTNGHCSIEDARACMEIVLDAVLKDVEKYKKGIF